MEYCIPKNFNGLKKGELYHEKMKRLAEIFFSLALYYESGDSVYGIVKNLKKANEYFELAIHLETEQEDILPEM